MAGYDRKQGYPDVNDDLDMLQQRDVLAGFLGYRHTGAPADAVFSRNALHQLPDFWKSMALHRIAQILRPRWRTSTA